MRNHRWDWAGVHHVALRETRSVLGPGPDAEDAAQEAAMRAWRRRATCRDAPGAWIRAIARNEALRTVDRRRDEESLDTVGELQGNAAAGVESQDVRAAVGALEQSDRLLLLLRYWADLTQPEVARATALPEGTVKVRLHRARQRLRVELSAA